MASRSQRPLYRKQALDKLASPEELDRLMQITRPGSWLVLAGFGGVLLMALLWSVFGRITSPLQETGTLALSNPVVYVIAPIDGQVLQIDAEPGDMIAAEIPLARVANADGSQSVTSPVNGRVLSVRVKIGEPVDAGTPLLSIEVFGNADRAKEVITFVTLEDRQRIRPGMDVQILPSTIEREKYGYLEGRVTSVAEYAATREEMLTVLGDERFVAALNPTEPLFEGRVSINTDDEGHYQWSASEGPATRIVIGTPCEVRITIDSERPISKIFNLSS